MTPNISRLWQEAFENYSKYRDRPEFQGWFDTFAPNNTWLKPGEMFRCPDMAKTLKKSLLPRANLSIAVPLLKRLMPFSKKHNGFLPRKT